ncbi:MAG: hypothetical protein JXB36_12215 [Gammaproteobacteria bacterium]|nr:hypothetical protein [Gammaproteobacteria bacterium]
MVHSTRHFTLLAAAVFATAIGNSGRSLAAEASYEMTAYVESLSGRRAASGDYGGAIEYASRRAAVRDPETRLIESTSLCVAYTMTGSFDEAHAACEDALESAQRVDDRASHMTFRSESETARAMSNRGVLKAVTGDMAGAEDDFRAASTMSGGSNASGRNLAHLEGAVADRLAMAQSSE